MNSLVAHIPELCSQTEKVSPQRIPNVEALVCHPLLLAELLGDGRHGSEARGIRPPYPAHLHSISNHCPGSMAPSLSLYQWVLAATCGHHQWAAVVIFRAGEAEGLTSTGTFSLSLGSQLVLTLLGASQNRPFIRSL